MDIYQYAMQMEKDGENFYRELAGRTVSTGLKKILNMLVDAEVRHYRLFENMRKNETIEPLDIKALSYVKNIFEIMKEEQQFDLGVSEIGLYRKAQEIEKRSREFYLEKADEVNKSQKEIFLKVAAEEQRHFLILEDIINMVNRPNQWLENPEWYHIEEY